MTKRGITAIFLFLIPALCSFSQAVTPEYSFNVQEGNIFYHTVEQGQTVYGLSIMYHVSEEDIYKLNPGSRESIKTGEKLKIPQKNTFDVPDQTDNNRYIFHTIQPKETMFSVSNVYKIKVEDLSNANPGITPENFPAGKTIRIPIIQPVLPVTERRIVTREIDYTVKRRDTSFGISRTFKITEDQLIKLNPQIKNGLKAGMIIKIPVETEEIVTVMPNQNESDITAFMASGNRYQKVDTIKIALLLPLFSSDARIANSRTEFYEGFLMAVLAMRDLGIPIEFWVEDIGDNVQKTREALQNNQLLQANLLVGGNTNEQIELIAGFALRNGIKYIVPFSSTIDKLTASNASIFQVNVPSQYLYSYATALGYSFFSNYNIIFVNTNDPREDKTQFVRIFKADLTQRNVSFRDVTFNERTFSADVSNLLSSTKPNVIVPSSSSLETLNKIRGPLRTLLTESGTAPQITLFGYPEWQRYTSECLEDFYALNTHIYTPFFANNQSAEIQQFNARYKYWYNKNMIQAYPKYAMLGYDTGMFFLTAIHTFGANFENNIRQVNYNSLQYGFNFERFNNWGGFMNTNLYIVRYNKDFTITRSDR